MSKYDALREHLDRVGDSEVRMSFAEVDEVVGGLPPSAFKYREWWSNHPGTSAPRNGWLAAARRVENVSLTDRVVSFSIPGAEKVKNPVSSPKTRQRQPPELAEVVLEAEDVRSLESFLTFRGESKELRHRIAALENLVEGKTALSAIESSESMGVDDDLLDGARLAKRLAAQVDVVLHAAGILRSLPFILDEGEIIESVSLGAGNTGRPYDLETDRRVAEFKFIDWTGGPESVRQDGLLIDIFQLDTSRTEKAKVMYLTGAEVPLHWLRTTRRKTRECLGRKRRIPARFDEAYGPTQFEFVNEYWASIENSVQVVDLRGLVPGL